MALSKATLVRASTLIAVDASARFLTIDEVQHPVDVVTSTLWGPCLRISKEQYVFLHHVLKKRECGRQTFEYRLLNSEARDKYKHIVLLRITVKDIMRLEETTGVALRHNHKLNPETSLFLCLLDQVKTSIFKRLTSRLKVSKTVPPHIRRQQQYVFHGEILLIFKVTNT